MINNYNDFLEFIFTPLSYFINWLSLVANNLIHNYFFITILGLVLFVSLFWFLYNIIFGFLSHKINQYEDFNDKYDDYVESKQIRSLYLDKHRLDEFAYLYDYMILKQQVLNGIYQNHSDLILDNKIQNLKLNITALKDLRKSNLDDNDISNDEDVDMILPNPPKPQLADWNELKVAELKEFRKEIKDDVNSQIDKILLENGYIDYNGQLVNAKTGEVVNLDNSISKDEMNRILQKDFEDYNGSLQNYENDFNRESKDTFYSEFYEGVYK